MRQMAGKHLVLDVCCGSRMFWFDRANPLTVFADVRHETHLLKDKSSKGGYRTSVIAPDIRSDFTKLPFRSNHFAHVVFDPPHFNRNGQSGWIAKTYGTIGSNWRQELRLGFAECFRVLRPEGTLVFKWNSGDIPVSRILELTPRKPLYGNRCGKTAKTHWITFIKCGAEFDQPEPAQIELGAETEGT